MIKLQKLISFIFIGGIIFGCSENNSSSSSSSNPTCNVPFIGAWNNSGVRLIFAEGQPGIITISTQSLQLQCSSSDTQVFLSDITESSCGNTVGTYNYSFTSSALTLDVDSDSCTSRSEVLSRTWTKVTTRELSSKVEQDKQATSSWQKITTNLLFSHK